MSEKVVEDDLEHLETRDLSFVTLESEQITRNRSATVQITYPQAVESTR